LKSINDPRYLRFLERLVAARKESGITQQELAARLKRHQTYVSKVERGERLLDLFEFLHWARGLNADALELLRELVREVNEGRPRRRVLPDP
jgi:transcriptional regulator with XRE-family HTH domain